MSLDAQDSLSETGQSAFAKGSTRGLLATIIGCLSLLVFFNSSFNIYAQAWQFDFLFPVELVLMVTLLLAGGLSPWLGRVLPHVAGAAMVFAVIVHLIDILTRSIYGRAIDLVFDASQIPNVLDLLATSMGWTLVSGIVLAFLAGFTVLGMVAYLIVIKTAANVQSKTQGLALPTKQILVIPVLVLSVIGIDDGLRPWGETPVVFSARSIEETLDHLELATLWIDGGQAAIDEMRSDRGMIVDGSTTLPGLADTNIYLIFIESYGASLLERDHHRTVVDGLYKEYGAKFAKRGLKSASAQLISSTYGGLSWLAHLSVGSGEWIDNNLRYRAFIGSDMDTLQTILSRTGHHTHLVMPGIRGYWPEGELLRFDNVYAAADLGYEGIHFGFFAIPDQYTLERLPSLVAETGKQPFLAQVALITSHYPFRPIPPFIEAREKVLTGPIWKDAADAAGSFEIKDWADPTEGYIKSAEYSIRSAFDFVARHAQPEDLVILMGDHQPWSIVSGNLGGRAAPIHVITGQDSILDCFEADGFVPGMMPERNEGLYGMDIFLHRLITHFGEASDQCGPPFNNKKFKNQE